MFLDWSEYKGWSGKMKGGKPAQVPAPFPEENPRPKAVGVGVS